LPESFSNLIIYSVRSLPAKFSLITKEIIEHPENIGLKYVIPSPGSKERPVNFPKL